LCLYTACVSNKETLKLNSETKNWDNDFVDEEDDGFSSSGVLPRPLSDVSGTYGPHLKQNLSPEFTLQPHETQNAAIWGN